MLAIHFDNICYLKGIFFHTLVAIRNIICLEKTIFLTKPPTMLFLFTKINESGNIHKD